MASSRKRKHVSVEPRVDSVIRLGRCIGVRPRGAARNLGFVSRTGSHGRVQGRGGTESQSAATLRWVDSKALRLGLETREEAEGRAARRSRARDRASGRGGQHWFQSGFGGRTEHSQGRLPAWRWGRKLGGPRRLCGVEEPGASV